MNDTLKPTMKGTTRGPTWETTCETTAGTTSRTSRDTTPRTTWDSGKGRAKDTSADTCVGASRDTTEDTSAGTSRRTSPRASWVTKRNATSRRSSSCGRDFSRPRCACKAIGPAVLWRVFRDGILSAASRGNSQSLRAACFSAPGAECIEPGFGLGRVLVEAGKGRATVVRTGGAVLELARAGALPNLAH